MRRTWGGAPPPPPGPALPPSLDVPSPAHPILRVASGPSTTALIWPASRPRVGQGVGGGGRGGATAKRTGSRSGGGEGVERRAEREMKGGEGGGEGTGGPPMWCAPYSAHTGRCQAVGRGTGRKHTHTHTHNLRKHSKKRFWLSENPRQLVIRQDKQSMSDANRRLSAVQGERRRHILHPFTTVSSPRQPAHTHTHTHTHPQTQPTDLHQRSGRCRQVSQKVAAGVSAKSTPGGSGTQWAPEGSWGNICACRRWGTSRATDGAPCSAVLQVCPEREGTPDKTEGGGTQDNGARTVRRKPPWPPGRRARYVHQPQRSARPAGVSRDTHGNREGACNAHGHPTAEWSNGYVVRPTAK